MSFVSSSLTAITSIPSLPLLFAIIALLLYTFYLHRKIINFTRGETGASLEEVIKQCVESVKEIERRNEVISEHALSLNTRVSHALRNAQTLRYKAFEVNGSNQSFSIALLNEHGNGVVITSLHARDRISTFAKPVEKYASSYDLTEEEKHVIEESKKSHKESV